MADISPNKHVLAQSVHFQAFVNGHDVPLAIFVDYFRATGHGIITVIKQLCNLAFT